MAICPICKLSIGPGEARKGPAHKGDGHIACIQATAREGCPVCNKPIGAEDFQLYELFTERPRFYHNACLDAEIAETTDSGIAANVREGLMEARKNPDGTMSYRLTERGIAKTKELLERSSDGKK
jgi:hypothetical protein